MEVGCPCWRPGAESITELIPALAAQGVRSVELGLWVPEGFFDYRRPVHVSSLVESLDGGPIKVRTIHTPFGPEVDFSLPGEPHNKGIQAQLDSIELAKRVAAEVLVVHGSSGPITTDRKARLDRARGVIRDLAKEAEAAGVTLAIENLTPRELGGDWEECLWLIEQADSPAVGCCFDSGHANLTGKFREQAEHLLPVSVTTHLHDNGGEKDDHAIPGTGNIDWPGLMRIYRDSGSRAILMLENLLPDGVQWDQALSMFRAAAGLE